MKRKGSDIWNYKVVVCEEGFSLWMSYKIKYAKTEVLIV